MAINIGPRIGIDGEKEYREQISNIIQQTKTLEAEYKKVSSTMEQGTTTLKGNAEQHRILSERIKTQQERVKELSSMLEQSKAKFGEADTKTLKWAQAVEEASTKLNQLQNELKGLPSQLELVGQKMQTAGDKIKSVGKNITSVGTSLSTKLTLPLVAAGTKAVQSFAEVDKTMTLANKTMNNTTGEAKLLSKAMKDAASNSTFGMSDAATAMLNFARAGLDAEEAAAAVAPAMNLAAGEGGNLEMVSAGLTATINAFGDSFDKTEHYADVFAAACNNSALDVDSLSEAMSIAAPIFKTTGKEVDDAALFMGVMANNGIEASVAANSLKTGLARIASPAKQGAEALSQLGINIFDSNGHMKDSVEVQQILHDSFSKLSEQEQMAAASAIFGKNQMSAWLALINTAPESVQNLNTELQNSAGTTQEMADAMMSGFGGSLEKLKSSIDVAVSSLGEALAPTIGVVADKIQSAVDWFNSLDESEQQQIARIGLMVAAAGPLLVIGGKLITGVGTLVSGSGTLLATVGKMLPMVGTAGTSFGTMATGAGTAGTAIAGIAAPAAIAVGAVGALTGAFITAYNEDEEFAAEVNQSWAEMKDSIMSLINTVRPAWEAFSKTIAPVFVGAMKIIKNVIDTIQQQFEGFVKIIKGIVSGDWKMACEGMAQVLTSNNDLMTKNSRTTSETIKDIFGKMEIKLPTIKMPHFSVESTDKFGLPKIRVDWYAKAMQNGMRLTDATIFGMANGRLLGGGEAGNEWIVGENSLMGMIRSAVGSAGNNVSIGDTQIIINTLPGQDEVEIANMVDEIITSRMEQAAQVWA